LYAHRYPHALHFVGLDPAEYVDVQMVCMVLVTVRVGGIEHIKKSFSLHICCKHNRYILTRQTLCVFDTTYLLCIFGFYIVFMLYSIHL